MPVSVVTRNLHRFTVCTFLAILIQQTGHDGDNNTVSAKNAHFRQDGF